jgi:hypothetical protein
MSSVLDALTAEVAATVTVEESALQLIDNIAAQLKAAGPNAAAIQQVVDTLTAERARLAADVAANTPAAPAPAASPDRAILNSGDPGAPGDQAPSRKITDPDAPGGN